MTINDNPDILDGYQPPVPGFFLTPADPVTRSIVIGFTDSGAIRLSTPPNLTIYEWKAAKGLVGGLLESIDQHQYGGTK